MHFTSLFLVALCGLTNVPTGLAASSSNSSCSATGFYEKGHAYTSGIIFKRGDKVHDTSYGHFWNGVEGNTTKNIGLKEHKYGYDQDLKGYQWGNITLPGYVGGARDFLLGMQMAMASSSGLLSPSVEKAMYDGVMGEKVKGWDDIEGLPELSSTSGSSMRAGILSVWNGTLVRAVEYNIEEEQKNKTMTVERSELSDWNTENERSMTEIFSTLSSRSAEEDCDDDSSDSEDDETDDSKYKKAAEESALYRAPWVESKPVYFFGECEKCEKTTGFNSEGHGSFQYCSLIYQGKEYTGKTGETSDKHYCSVEYDC